MSAPSMLEPVPFAAASVGQVHRARLNTGERVVVKVLKQEFEARFRKDSETNATPDPHRADLEAALF